MVLLPQATSVPDVCSFHVGQLGWLEEVKEKEAAEEKAEDSGPAEPEPGEEREPTGSAPLRRRRTGGGNLFLLGASLVGLSGGYHECVVHHHASRGRSGVQLH